MFALQSLIHSHCIETKSQQCRCTTDASTFLLDAAIATLAVVVALKLIKTFPQEFLTKERILILKATAIAIGAVDLSALVIRCCTTQKLSTTQRKT